MTQENITCPGCHFEFAVHRHPKARWAAAGIGGLFGTLATESVLGGIVVGALAFTAAKAYDEHKAHQCPECGTVTFPALAREEGESVPVHINVEAVRH
jgi:uncharacterized Zn finger protein